MQSNRSSPLTEVNLVSKKLSSICTSDFGYNPLVLMPVVALPNILDTLGLSNLLHVPLSVALISYLKSEKDKLDRNTAVGRIRDDNVRLNRVD
jgi:hypothetical protein